jgi:hypothetical protein
MGLLKKKEKIGCPPKVINVWEDVGMSKWKWKNILKLYYLSEKAALLFPTPKSLSRAKSLFTLWTNTHVGNLIILSEAS